MGSSNIFPPSHWGGTSIAWCCCPQTGQLHPFEGIDHCTFRFLDLLVDLRVDLRKGWAEALQRSRGPKVASLHYGEPKRHPDSCHSTKKTRGWEVQSLENCWMLTDNCQAPLEILMWNSKFTLFSWSIQQAFFGKFEKKNWENHRKSHQIRPRNEPTDAPLQKNSLTLSFGVGPCIRNQSATKLSSEDSCA